MVSGLADGPVSVQRFVACNVNDAPISDYLHMSVPVTGATVAKLATAASGPT